MTWPSELASLLATEKLKQQKSNVTATSTITAVDLYRFFSPAFDVFDALFFDNIHLRTGTSYMPRRIMSGSSMRQAVISDQVPSITLQLDPLTSLSIVPALKRGRPREETLLTARWRCRLHRNGTDIDVLLVDNKQSLAEWVFKHVLHYAVMESGDIPAGTIPLADIPEPSPTVTSETRNQRVITLDDICLNEDD